MTQIRLEQSRNSRGKNWIAKITGSHPKWGLKRDFVESSVVGCWAYYQLTDGIYEISEPRSLGKTYRHFLRITGEDQVGLTSDETMAAIREMEEVPNA